MHLLQLVDIRMRWNSYRLAAAAVVVELLLSIGKPLESLRR